MRVDGYMKKKETLISQLIDKLRTWNFDDIHIITYAILGVVYTFIRLFFFVFFFVFFCRVELRIFNFLKFDTSGVIIQNILKDLSSKLKNGKNCRALHARSVKSRHWFKKFKFYSHSFVYFSLYFILGAYQL